MEWKEPSKELPTFECRIPVYDINRTKKFAYFRPDGNFYDHYDPYCQMYEGKVDVLLWCELPPLPKGM